MQIFKLDTPRAIENFCLHVAASSFVAGLSRAFIGSLGMRITILLVALFWVFKELRVDGHLDRILTGRQTSDWWFDLWTDWFSQLSPLVLFWMLWG